MIHVASMTPAISMAALVEKIAPKRRLADPLGLVSGYRAYLVYTHLNNKSDSELSWIGLARKDIARVAMEAVFQNRPDPSPQPALSVGLGAQTQEQ